MRDADIKRGIFPTSHSVVVTDATRHDNPIVFVTAAFETLTGYSPKDVIGRNCRFLQGSATDPVTLGEIREALKAGLPVRREMLNFRKDGTPFWNDVAIDPIFDAEGVVSGFIGVKYDCSAKYAALRACTDAETRLARIVGNVPGYVFQRVLRADGTMSYSYVSGSLLRLLGVVDDGRPPADQAWALLHPDDRDALLQASIVSAKTLRPLCVEFRFVTGGDHEHWFRAASTPCPQENGDVLWDGIAIDVDLEKSTQSRLDFLTDHDRITGLLNRDSLRARMVAATSTFVPGQDRLALFSLDLDQFQEVNEAWGQSFGDRLLRAIGARLKSATETVHGIVARVGGDEFAVLIRTPDDDGRVLAIAEELRRELAEPFWEAGLRAAVDACIGAAVFSPLSEVSQAGAAEDWASELMKRANLALSAAKKEGRGRCRLYSADLDDRQRNQAVLRQSLQLAIDERQFLLHYQPIANLETGEVIGAEALVRWLHPELGLQRPDVFIPMAETSGLIGPLGAWVTQRAMAQAQEWRRQGLRLPRMAINVSGVQLLSPGFLAGVEAALEETGAEASDFEFELTEGTMIEASGQGQERLKQLRALGFGLAIDDFGTGHSTFRYLRDFRVDKIKIDRSFIRQLVINSNDASIIRSIITLSHSLAVEVVAEGVATDMQRAFLCAEGCRVGQGSLFGMPVPARDFARLLRRRVPAVPLVTAAQ